MPLSFFLAAGLLSDATGERTRRKRLHALAQRFSVKKRNQTTATLVEGALHAAGAHFAHRPRPEQKTLALWLEEEISDLFAYNFSVPESLWKEPHPDIDPFISWFTDAFASEIAMVSIDRRSGTDGLFSLHGSIPILVRWCMATKPNLAGVPWREALTRANVWEVQSLQTRLSLGTQTVADVQWPPNMERIRGFHRRILEGTTHERSTRSPTPLQAKDLLVIFRIEEGRDELRLLALQPEGHITIGRVTLSIQDRVGENCRRAAVSLQAAAGIPAREPAILYSFYVDTRVRGKGVGAALALLGIGLAAEQGLLLSGGACLDASTSPYARATYARLAQELPHAISAPSREQLNLPGIPVFWGGPLLEELPVGLRFIPP